MVLLDVIKNAATAVLIAPIAIDATLFISRVWSLQRRWRLAWRLHDLHGRSRTSKTGNKDDQNLNPTASGDSATRQAAGTARLSAEPGGSGRPDAGAAGCAAQAAAHAGRPAAGFSPGHPDAAQETIGGRTRAAPESSRARRRRESDDRYLAVAYVLALPIGWDREKNARSAGLRTFPLVSMASCAYMITGIQVLDSTDAEARVMYGLITGM